MLAQYAGRQPGIVVKALNLDREAAELIEELASHPRAQGQYVSRLVLEDRARREERARARALLAEPEGEQA